jgi:hypothetical protein
MIYEQVSSGRAARQGARAGHAHAARGRYPQGGGRACTTLEEVFRVTMGDERMTKATDVSMDELLTLSIEEGCSPTCT